MFMSKATFLTFMLFYFEFYSKVEILATLLISFSLLEKQTIYSQCQLFWLGTILISLHTFAGKFKLFCPSKIWLLLLTSSVVKKLSDNLNWIDKSSSGTYHKYALCTRVWKVAAKTGTALCNRHFSKTPDYIYLKTKSANDSHGDDH